MDVESQETIIASIDAAKKAIGELLTETNVDVNGIVRNAIAELVSAGEGWELTISPITIKLGRVVK